MPPCDYGVQTLKPLSMYPSQLQSAPVMPWMAGRWRNLKASRARSLKRLRPIR